MSVLSHRLPARRLRGSEAVISEARERQRRRRLRFALALLVAAGAGAVGYGISQTASGGHAAAPCASDRCDWWKSPAPFQAVATPFLVPMLSGHDLLTGRPLGNADFAGRAGFLLVWMSYCQPCKGELAGVEAFAAAHPQIPVVGLDTGPPDTPARGKAMLRRSHVSFPSMIVSQSILLRLRLRGYPSILAFNAEGKVVAISRGYAGRTPANVLASEAARIAG